MVNNTSKNFEVTWDDLKNAINLISNKAYTSVGEEIAKGDGKAKQATRTNSKIFVDGGEVSMTAYNIGGSNYFKLCDVMQIFDIGVGWDGATSTATINTKESYALTAYKQSKYDALQKAYQEALANPFQYKPIYDGYKFTQAGDKMLIAITRVRSSTLSRSMSNLMMIVYWKSATITCRSTESTFILFQPAGTGWSFLIKNRINPLISNWSAIVRIVDRRTPLCMMVCTLCRTQVKKVLSSRQ